jgi:hypothetical protein
MLLRDDIATNLVPAVNNSFADLQAKVNAILAALGAVGIIGRKTILMRSSIRANIAHRRRSN